MEGKGRSVAGCCSQALRLYGRTLKDCLRCRRNAANRGTRRRRDEDRAAVSAAFLMVIFILSPKCLILLRVYDLCFQRPVPLTEIKVSPPKFDLAATNFPPLPGCVVSTQGEPVLETRMSDVVRGLYKDKARRSKLEWFVYFCCPLCVTSVRSCLFPD